MEGEESRGKDLHKQYREMVYKVNQNKNAIAQAVSH
jgi:peptide methionine sulfoxide reductase MsrA